RFVAGIVAATGQLHVGDPRQDGVDVGPLVARDRRKRVQELLDDAVEGGATLHCGGPTVVEGLQAPFVAPAVLTGLTASMRLPREEVPGPVLSVEVVPTESAAIAAA